MDVDELKAFLAKKTSIDPEASFADFSEENAGPEGEAADRWLDWMRQAGTLSPEEFAAAHASQAVVAEPSAYDASSTHRYTKLGQVGRGGMAVIHVARDEDLQRKVAYKVMAANVRDKQGPARRFLAEAQITAQLEHPNIVPVYAIEPEEGSGALAYSMKLIDGKTLKELLKESSKARRGPGPVPRELRLRALLEHFLKCCDALTYAHGKGVMHRDIKPTNIMVGPHGEVYVMDWGLAKLVSGDDEESIELREPLDGDEATRMGQVLGTPAYMAPEQARGQADIMGPAADQYALGLILYEMVCGRRARPKLEGQQVVLYAREGRLQPMEPAGPRERLRPEMRAIIEKATEFEPEHRYASVGELGDDVRRFLANAEVQARPDNPLQRFQRSLSRNREATFLTLVALVAAIAVIVAVAATRSYNQRVAAEQHSERLAGFVSDVAQIAAAVDAHFAEMEVRVEGLAQAAEQLAEHGEPQDEHWYTVEDLSDPDRAPPDLAWSNAYGEAITTRWMDVFHPDGYESEDVRAHASRLTPLRHVLRRLHLVTRSPDGVLRDDEAAERRWRDEAAPILYAGVGFEDGLYVELPGFAWRTEGFDARVRPWYALGKVRGRPQWGNPFEEAGSQGRLIMPCSMGIFAPDGSLEGVASVMSGFDYLIEHYLLDNEVEGARESFLVSGDGHIMLRSSDLRQRSDEAAPMDRGYQTPPFPDRNAVAAFSSRRSGYLESGGALFGWQRLRIEGWTLVVEADPI